MKLRVLVAEDEDLIRDVVVDILETHGHEVMEADSGERALQLCAEAAPPAGHFKFLRVWSVKFLHPARQDMMIVSLTLFPGQGLQRPL